ncbi:transcriptional regulator [Sphingosinicella sp. CPCC 101087]|uniref:transcriptional regulator n=1 Tax=Sphingosinicella sp. CPCC 101087 TaxID=2497754 RepID=UPI001980895F|nr:transcriptional regulator [Sphingosinicella sp. CPCC 101087]
MRYHEGVTDPETVSKPAADEAEASPFAAIAALDRLIHDPSRLAILTALIEWAEADFPYLLGATGLTKGNLSSHLGKLEAGGLVQVSKGFKDKKPWTRVMLTRDGRGRIQAHWEELERIRRETMGLA